MREFLCFLLLLVLGAPFAPPAAADEPATLVDWLKSLGTDASYEARATLYGERFSGEEYRGTGPQNLALWRALKAEAADGRFPPTAATPKPAPRVREGVEPASGDATGPAPAARPPAHAPDARPGATPAGPVATRTVEATDGANRLAIELDPRAQVLSIETREVERSVRGDAPTGSLEAEIFPTLPSTSGFVSAAMLVQKAKIFDDGLYAAVELAAESGAGAFRGKRALLDALRARLLAAGDVPVGPPTATLFAAARAGGRRVPTPPALVGLVDAMVEGFDSTPVRSKPIGFYTWSDALRAVFRQDRMLQAGAAEPAAAVEVVARALHADPAVRDTYERYLALVERLTNPFVGPDYRSALEALDAGEPVPTESFAFFPACRSRETLMANALLAGGMPIEQLRLMDAFVDAVRAGRVSLAPRPDSGWYDRQQWALEPFVRPEATPEGGKVQRGPRYRARLEELFRGALALTRETHVKNLDIAVATAMAPPPQSKPRVYVGPDLTVEPHASAWWRRAESYRYVAELLAAVFGPGATATMHRETPDGPVSVSLADELRSMEALFTGAYVRSCKELGFPVGVVAGADAAEATFVAWARAASTDADLARDVRMMIPVAVDPMTGTTRSWAVLGWASDELGIRFVRGPTAVVRSAADGKALPPSAVEVVLGSQSASVAYPVFVEVTTRKVLDRDEFRRLCDAAKTRERIVNALER